jgi:hypothetical protein
MTSPCDCCGIAAQSIRYRREINRHKFYESAALEIVTQSMRNYSLIAVPLCDLSQLGWPIGGIRSIAIDGISRRKVLQRR